MTPIIDGVIDQMPDACPDCEERHPPDADCPPWVPPLVSAKYNLHFDLEDGVRVEVLLWTVEEESKVFYRYHYVRETEGVLDVELVNEFRVYARYVMGKLQDIEVWNHVTIPPRLGKKYLYGMDVSPNAKVFVVFFYRPDEHTDAFDQPFKLWKVQVGAREYELPTGDEEGLVPVLEIDFPFPVQGEIDRAVRDRLGVGGGFVVQYRHCDETVREISVSPSIGEPY